MEDELFGLYLPLPQGSIPGEEELEDIENDVDIWDEDGDAEADRYASRCLDAFWPE